MPLEDKHHFSKSGFRLLLQRVEHPFPTDINKDCLSFTQSIVAALSKIGVFWTFDR